MSRTNSAVLFGFFVAVIVAMCGAGLMKGGLFIGKHEGDTYHVLQIVFRMADGQWPHLDFMTPIGALAFAPIALFVKLGFGVGHAILLSQALVSVALLPAIWWTAYSRMHGWLAYMFGGFVIVLITALVHGESQQSISISMHYNRWAWAASFLAISLAILPNLGPKRPILDGLTIGLCMSILLMLKMTYFIMFLIPVTVALILRCNTRALLMAAFVGLGWVTTITALAGLDYWVSYLRDLLVVAGSEIRSAPSNAFGAVVGAPAYLAGSLILLTSVVLLRLYGEKIAGLVLLLLVPGFFYVTYQNFANDPQWLLLLGVLLFALLPAAGVTNRFGWEARGLVRTIAIVALTLAAPSFLNLVYSPFRHLATDVSEYEPMLPRSGVHEDISAGYRRTIRVSAEVPLDGANSPYAAYADIGEIIDATVFLGEELPMCQIKFGMTSWFQTAVDDLNSAGLADGKRVFAADIFSSYWLFGPLLPLEKGAPWYYGGLPGFASADYLIVPLCPVARTIQAQILQAVTETGVGLNEIRRTPLYILYDIQHKAG